MNKSQVRSTHFRGRFYLETKSWYHKQSACRKVKAKLFSKPKQLSCKIAFFHISLLFVQLLSITSNNPGFLSDSSYSGPEHPCSGSKTNRIQNHIYICNKINHQPALKYCHSMFCGLADIIILFFLILSYLIYSDIKQQISSHGWLITW